jgi:hypothetical protein
MNMFLEDKKPSNSVDTDFFWKETPRINLDEKSINSIVCEIEPSYQENKNYNFNTLAFCEFVDDVVNMNKLRDYNETPDMNSLSGYVDITRWNEMFNISSGDSVIEEANMIPNYYNLLVENN